MRRIMSKGKVNLFFNESENKFYSEDPKVIITALDEDCNSPHFMDALMANAVKQMIKDADGKIYKMHPDKMSVHVIRIRVSDK
jgi:hypothetical protein